MARSNVSKIKFIIKEHKPLKDIEMFTECGFLYLVGPNASGKSRFLDALKNKKCSVTRPHLGTHRGLNYAYIEWGKADYNEVLAVKSTFSKENNTCRAFNHPIVAFENETRNVEEGKTDDNRPIIRQELVGVEHLRDTKFLGIDMFSSGMQRHYEINNWALPRGLKSHSHSEGQPEIIVVSIEEPETNLHPDAARKIPEQLEKWVGKQNVSYSSHGNQPSILCVITTHSPFILKGACDRTLTNKHQVFGFNECRLQDLSGREQDDLAKKGLSGQQALIQASKMLGAGFSDLMPSPIVLMESTIHALLSNIQEAVSSSTFKKSVLDPRTALVINPNGDPDTNLRVKSIKDLVHMLSLLSARKPEGPLIDMKLLVLTDDVKHADELNSLYENEVGVRVSAYSLGVNQLEDSYEKNIRQEYFESLSPGVKIWENSELISTYLYNELGYEKNRQGPIKYKLAVFVGQKVTSKTKMDEIIPGLKALIKKINTEHPC